MSYYVGLCTFCGQVVRGKDGEEYTECIHKECKALRKKQELRRNERVG